MLPIGLRAPVIQWDNKGTAATGVKVSLQYPATGAASFSWSEIIAGKHTAAGYDPAPDLEVLRTDGEGESRGQHSLVQRVIGTTPRLATTRTLNLRQARPCAGTSTTRSTSATGLRASPTS